MNKAEQYYEESVTHQVAMLEAKELRKELVKDGQRVATIAMQDLRAKNLPLEEIVLAIRAIWAPYDERIAEIEARITGHQEKADAAYEAYERAY